MFLVLVETVDEAHPDSVDQVDREWEVTAHTRFGVRTPFDTREEAEEYAMSLAAMHSNRYAVVEITEAYSRVAVPQKIEVAPRPI